ncbi:MAG: hypothetical protein ACLPKE_29010 [Streptosporangiaceae bacterium]
MTAVTDDVAEDASGELAWDWMIDANAEPFCRRLTRCDTGVLGLKNASQFVLICAAAADEPPLADGAGDDGAAEDGAADDGAGDDGAADDLLADAAGLALPLLLHAATATTVPVATMRSTLAGGKRM